MADKPLEKTYHGSAAALFFKEAAAPIGLLIEGGSASGKSSLVLDLLTLGTAGALGLEKAVLVGDDQLVLDVRDDKLFVRGARRLSGLMEVRGLGLVRLSAMDEVEVGLRLVFAAEVERLPFADQLASEVEGVRLPTLPLHHGSHRAQIAVLAALALARGRRLEEFAEGGVPFSF